MSNLNILGISGSLRAKSVNLAALKACGEVMPAGMSLKIAALDDLPMYNFDLQEKGWPAAVQSLRDAMAAADGVIFACPEFNWTISAPLKNAIDWLSRFPAGQQPFQNKPIALISATGGPLGGFTQKAGHGDSAFPRSRADLTSRDSRGVERQCGHARYRFL